MSIRIAIRDIRRGLYSGLREVISSGGGVHYEGVFHGMPLRDLLSGISVVVYTMGSEGRHLLVGAFTMRVFSMVCRCVMSLRNVDLHCYSGYLSWAIQCAQGAISTGGGVHYEGVFHGIPLRDFIGVMLTRIDFWDICRGLYSGLRGAISRGGGFHYEGVFHGMPLRDVIGVMLICIAIWNICRGLYSVLKGQYLPVGAFTMRAFSMACGGVISSA
jgi:hypothetical protein